MNQEQALNILVQGINLAQSKGAYTLQEATLLAQAIDCFKPKEELKEKVVESAKTEI